MAVNSATAAGAHYFLPCTQQRRCCCYCLLSFVLLLLLFPLEEFFHNNLVAFIIPSKSSSPSSAVFIGVEAITTITTMSSSSSPSAPKLRFQSPLYTLAAAASTTTTTAFNNNEEEEKTALIILNSPITNHGEVFQQLWFASSLRICADGGANRLREYIIIEGEEEERRSSKNDAINKKKMIPDRIVGDLDSLQEDVKEYFSKKGCDIIKNRCQDTNDLDKAIQSCLDCEDKIDRILIYGAFGGRFDQEMASFQALYKWGYKYKYNLFLYCEDTFAFLIPGGNMECTIQLQQQPIEIECKLLNNNNKSTTTATKICEGPTCGLIPLGGTCDSVTTQGLQWDLTNQETKFGGLLSTSNKIISNDAQIYAVSSHPIVFTAEIRRW